MKAITALTSDPKQAFTVVLDDGTTVDISLSYVESQSGWFYSILYGSVLTINNRRLVNSPNMLRAYRNIIPFGLACVVTDGQEPVFIDDFTKGRVLFYVLSQADVAESETTIEGYRNA